MSGAGPIATPESPGRILRSAREAMGLSRREIAEALYLLESVVVAIEEDDVARQPEPVFMRGYVRNYARLLKLDPEPLIGALAPARAPTPQRTIQTMNESPSLIWPAVGVGLALAVLAGVVIHLLGAPSGESTAATAGLASVSALESATLEQVSEDVAEELTTPSSTEPAEALIEVENDDGPAQDPMGQDLRTQPPAVGESAPATVTAATTETVPADREAEQQESSTQTDSVAEAETEVAGVDVATAATEQGMGGVVRKRLNRGDNDAIRIHFTADCWVRIKDNTGRMIFSDMGRAGVEMELVGNGPFDILLGFAPAATLQWNGAAIALEPHMRNNVATLTLDQSVDDGSVEG